MFVLNVYSNSQLIQAGVPVTGELSLGRDSTNQVVISEPSVSRRHLVVRLDRIGQRDVVVLTDAGSRNGTFVNSQRIEERVVAPGDLIRFGCCRLEILEVQSRTEDLEDETSETARWHWEPFTEDFDAAARLRALYSMALGMTDLEVPFMLEKAAELVKTCVDFDQLCFLLEGSTEMVVCTSWDRSGPCPAEDIEMDRSILDTCIKLGQPFASVPSTPRHRKVNRRGRRGSAACVPLRAECRVLGALYCSISDPERRFSQEDVQFLTLVGCFVAAGISHRRHLGHTQKTAAKLETILASLQEGVVVCDSGFRILSANAAARRIFGRPSLVGTDLEEALEGFVHTFDPGAVDVNGSFDVERPQRDSASGKPFGIETYHATVSWAAGIDADGWVYIVCLRDVTRERYNELMQLAFVNRLAHKLRTPLTVIGGVTSLIAERVRGKDPEAEELFALAEEGCQQMADLIDQFIDFSSLGEQKAELRSCPMPVDLTYLVDQSLALAEEPIRASGLQVVNKVGPRTRQLVVIPEKICQCFFHFIQNSCKFAGSGATLTIEADDRESLVVRFTDDGPGIPPSDLKKVFDIFHQVDREGTGEVPGVGLGLWWSREVIRAHGGDIHVISPVTEGRGSRVEVLLPSRLFFEPYDRVRRKETRDVTDESRKFEMQDP